MSADEKFTLDALLRIKAAAKAAAIKPMGVPYPGAPKKVYVLVKPKPSLARRIRKAGSRKPKR